MHSAVGDFESVLRGAVRRRTRKDYSDEIREIVEHYEDLYEEGLLAGKSDVESKRLADGRIGTIDEIASRIISASTKSIALRLQWLAASLWLVGAFLIKFASIRLHGRISGAMLPIGLIVVYLAGFLAVLGIIRAGRVSVTAFGLAVAMISLGFTAVLLGDFHSFGVYDAKMKDFEDSWHQYALTYRPIMTERYEMYVASISGSQQESEQAMSKLSTTIKRPQDRGVVILGKADGKWIYPLKTDEVRKLNITVFPLRDDNLNFLNFGSTDSFEVAQKAWRSSDDLLKAIPILRKGSEAEFDRTSKIRAPRAITMILDDVRGSILTFLMALISSLLPIGIARKIGPFINKRSPAL
ncbi:MAG: hypothetical protein GC165_19305 [Armatimonadetes bacterium]|nr:hypothetical protein [Armatimonadota bacterium]